MYSSAVTRALNFGANHTALNRDTAPAANEHPKPPNPAPVHSKIAAEAIDPSSLTLAVIASVPLDSSHSIGLVTQACEVKGVLGHDGMTDMIAIWLWVAEEAPLSYEWH